MNKHIIGIILLALGLSLSAQGKAKGEVMRKGRLPSGRALEMLHWPGTEMGHVLVSYPKHFDPKNRYHINFAFPGTGGTPGPGIEDQNDHYVGILMSYLDQSNSSNSQYARDHWALCREVEATLRERVGFPVGQRVVSGVSKGGWLSFYMAVEAPEGLDGVGIIAAGRDPKTKEAPNLSRSGLSVFVGTGETDPNYPFAQLAGAYFKQCRLSDFSYEEWLGKGHSLEISPRVQEWLNMVAMRGEPEERFLSYCEGQVTKAWEEIQSRPDALDQYRQVRHLMNSPCMLHVSADFRSGVAAWGRELSSRAEVQAWLKDYGRLRELVRAEVRVYEAGSVEAEHLLKLDSGYRQLALETSHDDIRARAAYAHERNRKVVTMLEIRQKARKQPAHMALENKARKMHQQLSELTQRDEALMAEFNRLSRELAEARGKLQMDSFHQVEWENRYVLDGKIKPLIQAAAPACGPNSAHSGVAY